MSPSLYGVSLGTWRGHAAIILGGIAGISTDELPFVREDAANILFSNFMAGAEGIEVCPLEAIGEEDKAVLSSLCHHSPAVKCIVNVQATHDHD